MKIIIVADNLDLGSGGGVGTFLFELANEFALSGNEVALFGVVQMRNPNDELLNVLKTNGVRVEQLNVASRREALMNFGKYVLTLRRKIKEFAGEHRVVCNVHLKLGSLYGVMAAMGLKNIVCVETYHSQYHHYGFQYKCMSPFIQKYICVSQSAKEEFQKRFIPPKGKAIAIDNGIGMEAIRMHSEPISIGDHTFVSVGRLSYEKNLIVTAKAFAEVRQGVIYQIIGGGEDERIFDIEKESSHVNLLGALPRQNVLNIVAGSQMVVMPSLWEGLSIFQLEAMALGKPLMLSDIGSFRYVMNEKPLDNGEEYRVCKWGYLVQTDNVSAWVRAIEHCCKNTNLLGNMGKEVLKLSERFDIRTTAKKYVDEFYRTIDG